MLTLPPCNDDEAIAAISAITSIVSNIPMDKLKTLGEIASDPKRLERALNYMPLA